MKRLLQLYKENWQHIGKKNTAASRIKKINHWYHYNNKMNITTHDFLSKLK
jgi:hypothetical protein